MGWIIGRSAIIVGQKREIIGRGATIVEQTGIIIERRAAIIGQAAVIMACALSISTKSKRTGIWPVRFKFF